MLTRGYKNPIYQLAKILRIYQIIENEGKNAPDKFVSLKPV